MKVRRPTLVHLACPRVRFETNHEHLANNTVLRQFGLTRGLRRHDGIVLLLHLSGSNDPLKASAPELKGLALFLVIRTSVIYLGHTGFHMIEFATPGELSGSRRCSVGLLIAPRSKVTETDRQERYKRNRPSCSTRVRTKGDLIPLASMLRTGIAPGAPGGPCSSPVAV
jgi:hypothetical protein